MTEIEHFQDPNSLEPSFSASENIDRDQKYKKKNYLVDQTFTKETLSDQTTVEARSKQQLDTVHDKRFNQAPSRKISGDFEIGESFITEYFKQMGVLTELPRGQTPPT